MDQEQTDDSDASLEEGGASTRAEYRKERSTFEVGFLDNMRESLSIEDEGAGLEELDDFLAEQVERGGRRKGSSGTGGYAPSLDTIIGSPAPSQRTLGFGPPKEDSWGGREDSVDSAD